MNFNEFLDRKLRVSKSCKDNLDKILDDKDFKETFGLNLANLTMLCICIGVKVDQPLRTDSQKYAEIPWGPLSDHNKALYQVLLWHIIKKKLPQFYSTEIDKDNDEDIKKAMKELQEYCEYGAHYLYNEKIQKDGLINNHDFITMFIDGDFD